MAELDDEILEGLVETTWATIQRLAEHWPKRLATGVYAELAKLALKEAQGSQGADAPCPCCGNIWA